jgi:hypothetical protein
MSLDDAIDLARQLLLLAKGAGKQMPAGFVVPT